MSDKQFGFRKGHSTSAALNYFVRQIENAINHKNHVLGIFIDLSKAFDTIDHANPASSFTKSPHTDPFSTIFAPYSYINIDLRMRAPRQVTLFQNPATKCKATAESTRRGLKSMGHN